ncbi:MAG: hypothetical protein ACE5HT_10150 [Gemmatimonadales bacterium]
MILFDELPASARLWTFGCSRTLDETEERELAQCVELFLAGWAAHGVLLTSGWDWRYHQFLFVAADQSNTDPSGCSIDALVESIRTLQTRLGVEFLDHGPVFYRKDDSVVRVSRAKFSQLAHDSVVDLDTVVFDNTIQSVGELRSGRWEVAAKDSWHSRAFFAAAPASRSG